MVTTRKIKNNKFITFACAAIAEVAMVSAFITGWYSLAASWVLMVFIVVGCIITTLIIAMIILAGEGLDKAVERQLMAMGVPAITLSLMSGIILLNSVF